MLFLLTTFTFLLTTFTFLLTTIYFYISYLRFCFRLLQYISASEFFYVPASDFCVSASDFYVSASDFCVSALEVTLINNLRILYITPTCHGVSRRLLATLKLRENPKSYNNFFVEAYLRTADRQLATTLNRNKLACLFYNYKYQVVLCEI